MEAKSFEALRKIPMQDGRAIRHSVNTELIDLSRARNVKALTGHAYGFRLRVGNYRVLFDVEGSAACVVSIEEVRKRDERTY